MALGKAIRLSVRPTQSADLCFPMDGIIEFLSEDLIGRTVNAFDMVSLQDKLEPKVELPAMTSQLVTNSGSQGTVNIFALPKPVGDDPYMIESAFGNSILCRLRAKDIANNLTQALAWYGLKKSADQSDEAVKVKIGLLGKTPTDQNSITTLLNRLSVVLKSRSDVLDDLYKSDGLQVVKDPTSTSDSRTSTTGGQSFDTTSHTDTTYRGHEYQVPPADNTARYLRSEISLRQERLAAYRLVKLNSSENVLYAKAVTAADIRRIQLGYINTFLVAPFDGVVTAVFRNVGESVAVGQPVLRLENDKNVLIVGEVKYRGLIRVGYTAKITTTLFGEAGAAPVEVDGVVCAVRGHESVDEQWNVMIRCNNEGPAGRILPLNYNFEFENTLISFDS
ncbi:HlyD family secretion protein [Cupriavidus sp. BIS7]|uniref:HlyD family efflux transporter periplasmic adaptor subunit n=1 Tax=Cupriavidus sp. BIS7 TaxID=1217718 RepID=UPI000366307D|nr:HlyD family secretion protein [Cupriavidus sp. BIS7]